LAGVWFKRYAAALTVSGHISSGNDALMRIQQLLVTISPPECSAELFCFGEYGVDVSNSSPSLVP